MMHSSGDINSAVVRVCAVMGDNQDTWAIPDEILTKIFSYCTVNALYNVMLSCRRFNSCANVQSVWKAQLAKLIGCSVYDLGFTVKEWHSYKDMCRRFVEVFHGMPSGQPAFCKQCKCFCCQCTLFGSRDNYGHDEMIVFDFGSKTTWLKYTGDAGVGQLSMHPTIGPVISRTSRELQCAICMRVALQQCSYQRMSYDCHSSKRQGGGFVKQIRNLDCFGSLSDSDDVSGETTLPAVSQVSNEATPSAVSQVNRTASRQISASCVDVYSFLINHMLKRNPFFNILNIPFVVCEPTACQSIMKKQLVEYLLCQLKVPEICFMPKAIAISLYAAVDTCLVVDSGANNTVITPVLDQCVASHAVKHIPIGGTFLTRLLVDCIHSKGLDAEVTEASVDSSQVKRECYLSYIFPADSKRKIVPRTVFARGYRNYEMKMLEIPMSHELYQAPETMYLQLDLPRLIVDLVSTFPAACQRRLLSNIIITGGNSRLNGFGLRLTRDLGLLLPATLVPCIRLIDPRLMTGRSDAVIGAAYVRKWSHAQWIKRHGYIVDGVDFLDSDNRNQVVTDSLSAADASPCLDGNAKGNKQEIFDSIKETSHKGDVDQLHSQLLGVDEGGEDSYVMPVDDMEF